MFGEEYASIYAKVKSWVSVLLRESELEDLARMSQNELITYFKARAKKLSLQTDDIATLEGLIKQEGFYFLKSGLRFMSGATKDFIELWSKIYEIENLKILTRAIVYNKPVQYLYKLGDYSKIQTELVKDIRTLDELQEFLSGTDYFRLAQDSFQRIKEDKKTFHFEMNLDNYYSLNLRKKLNSLSTGDKKGVKGLLFGYLEINRILWIYRAKFNYSMNTEAVISTIPNILGFLSRIKYDKLVEAENEAAFIAHLKSFKLLDPDSQANDENLERDIYKMLAKKARKSMNGSPFNLGVFLGFIILHFISVKNIVKLLESKKLEIDSTKIIPLLVF